MPSVDDPHAIKATRTDDSVPDDEDWVVPITTRREGRERVVSLLYELAMKSISANELLGELTLNPDPFVRSRFDGIAKHGSEIDDEIGGYSKDWDLDRMPTIDRCILRLGIYELLFCPDIPTGVILSEAVELAQSYSTESSGKFINGLLSAAARNMRS